MSGYTKEIFTLKIHFFHVYLQLISRFPVPIFSQLQKFIMSIIHLMFSKDFPRIPKEIEVLKVKKQGQNDTSKDFVVRRYKVQNALNFLKTNNPAFSDIIIDIDRINALPVEGELSDIETIDYHPHND